MRTYGEAIDVRTGADALSGSDAPAQFLWRGRLYLVRDVLAHWVELGTWWSIRGARDPRSTANHSRGSSRSAGASTHTGSASSPESARPGPARPESARPEPVRPESARPEPVRPEPARSVAADVGAVEREVWRVEASSGRSGTCGVYDLVRDVPAARPRVDGDPAAAPVRERWRLARALD